MENTRSFILSALFIAVAFFAGFFLYSSLPDLLPVHFDAGGNVNGYMGKFWGVLIVPIIMTVLALSLFVLPKIDPLKENVSRFQSDYNALIVLILLFLLYVHGLVLAFGIGVHFNFTTLIIPAFAYLWFSLGVFLPKIKRNWFIGIRTPWTYSNEEVWDKTHAIAGPLFKFSALGIFIGMFFDSYLPWILLAAVILSVIIPIVYSFVLYKRIPKQAAPAIITAEHIAPHPSSPFAQITQTALTAETQESEIIVQSPIKKKREFFVMRADSKASTVFGNDRPDTRPQSSKHFEAEGDTPQGTEEKPEKTDAASE